MPDSQTRVVIVDDDYNFCEMVRALLKDEGYEAHACTQSLRAFDFIMEKQPDLVLMDLMMPYLDGLDQIKLMSLVDDLKDVPIIMITGRVGAMDRVENLRVLRIFDYMYKPIDLNELLEKIQRVVRDHVRPRPLRRPSLVS